ncbi:hypothetical protein ILYODFUR_033114 [Ilyodon furcidens]|uniref:Uncharacterized protein n=1 Tax=Ilyodon furcidens TaxID=33524 RepID=A0ABV0VLT4_9TELE
MWEQLLTALLLVAHSTIWLLWKSGKRETIVERKPKNFKVFYKTKFKGHIKLLKKVLWSDETKNTFWTDIQNATCGGQQVLYNTLNTLSPQRNMVVLWGCSWKDGRS